MNTNTNTNTNTNIYKERLKFYADTQMGQKNYLFCYNTNIVDLEQALFRFSNKGFSIRAAWYEKINTTTGKVIENLRIDIQTEFNKFLKLTPKERKNLN